MEETSKKPYEIGFLVAQEAHLSGIVDVLRQHGADVEHESPLRRITLSYPIEGREAAYFGFVYADIEPERIASINSTLQLQEEVLRHLIVQPPVRKHPEPKGKPSDKEGAPSEARQSKEQLSDQSSSKRLTNEDLQERLEEIMQ